jgi:hypothetical protein
VVGELHGVAVPVSSVQVAEIGEFVAVKSTVAELDERIEPFTGELIVTTGGGTTVGTTVAQPTFPAASVAQTLNVWVPLLRPVKAVGELHELTVPESTWQLTLVTPFASVAANVSDSELPVV